MFSLLRYVLNKVQDGMFIVTTDLEVMSQDEAFIAAAGGTTPGGAKARVLQSSLMQNTPGPAPSPSEEWVNRLMGGKEGGPHAVHAWAWARLGPSDVWTAVAS